VTHVAARLSMEFHFGNGARTILACSAVGQQPPGTLAALDYQWPKNGMVPQYERGRKQKAACHRQQNDTLPLFVWEILSGGQYGNLRRGALGSALG
jgi:hypothetical protein